MADTDIDDNDQFLQNNADDTNPINDMKDDEELAEDNDTPAAPPSGVQDRIDDTHQSTDTNVDEHEHYDAGIEAASSVEPPAETAVNEYSPDVPADEDDQSARPSIE